MQKNIQETLQKMFDCVFQKTPLLPVKEKTHLLHDFT